MQLVVNNTNSTYDLPYYSEIYYEDNKNSLVGHGPPVRLIERSDFDAVTGDHATAVVRRTRPRDVRTGLRHGNDWSAGRRVRRSCSHIKHNVTIDLFYLLKRGFLTTTSRRLSRNHTMIEFQLIQKRKNIYYNIIC